jgi:CrcB protein
MSAAQLLAAAVLSGVGAVARFAVDGAVTAHRGGDFPLGTLVVNLSGAFLLGFLVGVDARPGLLLLAGIATLGSYTTFSTWMLESQRLGEDGERALLMANVAVSLAAGLAMVALGRAAGGLL